MQPGVATFAPADPSEAVLLRLFATARPELHALSDALAQVDSAYLHSRGVQILVPAYLVSQSPGGVAVGFAYRALDSGLDRTLAASLRSPGGTLSLSNRITLARLIAEGVARCHDAGVITGGPSSDAVLIARDSARIAFDKVEHFRAMKRPGAGAVDTIPGAEIEQDRYAMACQVLSLLLSEDSTAAETPIVTRIAREPALLDALPQHLRDLADRALGPDPLRPSAQQWTDGLSQTAQAACPHDPRHTTLSGGECLRCAAQATEQDAESSETPLAADESAPPRSPSIRVGKGFALAAFALALAALGVGLLSQLARSPVGALDIFSSGQCLDAAFDQVACDEPHIVQVVGASNRNLDPGYCMERARTFVGADVDFSTRLVLADLRAERSFLRDLQLMSAGLSEHMSTPAARAAGEQRVGLFDYGTLCLAALADRGSLGPLDETLKDARDPSVRSARAIGACYRENEDDFGAPEKATRCRASTPYLAGFTSGQTVKPSIDNACRTFSGTYGEPGSYVYWTEPLAASEAREVVHGTIRAEFSFGEEVLSFMGDRDIEVPVPDDDQLLYYAICSAYAPARW